MIVCPLHSSDPKLEGPTQLLFFMLHIFPFAYIFALPVFRESLKWRLESCHFDAREASLTNVHLDSITDSSTHPPPFHFPSLFSTISNCKYFSLCKFLSNWFFLLGRVTSKTSNIQQNWREKTTKAIDGMFLECMSPLLKDWNLQYLIRKFHIHFNHIVIVVMQNTFTYPLDKWLWGQCVIVSTFFSAFLSECKKKSKIPSSPAPRRW